MDTADITVVYFSLFSNNIHTEKCYSAVKFNYVITSAILFYKEKEIPQSKYLQSVYNPAATHPAQVKDCFGNLQSGY